MKLTHKDLDGLLNLARLSVGPQDQEGLLKDLQNILSHVEGLQQVDVSQVSAMTHPMGTTLPTRPDQVQPGGGTAGLTQSAGYSDGVVRVPRVVE